MYKNIIASILVAAVMTGCLSPNLLRFGELDSDIANEDNIKNNLQGNILTISTSPDTESMTVVLPKNNLTVRVKVAIPNVEDILYMNIKSLGEFKIDKLVRRVSKLELLDDTQDGWIFEPSVEKNMVTLQLYLPSIYLYKNHFELNLDFAYKRDSRSLRDEIKLNFIKQQYYVIHNEKDNDYQHPMYGDWDEYCEATTNSNIDPKIDQQIKDLNKNRVDEEIVTTLKSICK